MTLSVSEDPVLPDKIQLLMEEASCDRAEAELAMSLVGYDLEKAIRTIGTLLRHIVVVKGKFLEVSQNLHGLLLLIADTRREHFIRARAVVSYNPALFETGLTPHWYDFERSIYAARLGEGTLQHVSQDLERSYIERLETRRDDFFSALKSPEKRDLPAVLNDGFSASFPRGVQSEFRPEVIDWNQFRRFPIKGEDRGSLGASPPRGSGAGFSKGGGSPSEMAHDEKGKGHDPLSWSEPPLENRLHGAGETLRIEMELVGDPNGPLASEVREGDRITVMLSDGRDIAHYIAKLFGAMNEKGPRPIDAPVETIQREKGRVRFYVRLSAGILGLAEVPETTPIRVSPREEESWWRRFLGKSSS
ncbi:MAG: hypothetical protein JNK54_05380 [Elusimicrobia bacterium]|nr:hypothetical protein [Elusimicrobiota bacterium]